jgi:hypothetical protein
MYALYTKFIPHSTVFIRRPQCLLKYFIFVTLAESQSEKCFYILIAKERNATILLFAACGH